MTQGTKPPAARPAAPPAPAAKAAPGPAGLVTRAKDAAGQEAERWLIRVSFTQPIFGQGEHQWTFVGNGHHAEDVAKAAMGRTPVRLAFPTNVVILDGALMASVDFQPHEA